MRVVSGILYVVVLLAICGLGIQGGSALQDFPSVSFRGSALQDYPTISFNLAGATSGTYRDFIAKLRQIILARVSAIDDKNYLPVLNPSLRVAERFILVRLIHYNGNTVTLALDATNLFVVAFSENNRAYFFSDASELELDNLFTGMIRVSLPFTGNYASLENKSGVSRASISLGLSPLSEATEDLYYGRHLPEALIVVFQMVSEAARFRHIEERVRRSMVNENTFRPDGLMLSMENSWSSLSEEVQRSIDGVIFSEVFELQNETLQPLRIDNVNTLLRHTMIAFLLFRPCNRAATSSRYTLPAAHIIRMPPDVVGKRCTIGEPTRRISGRDGLCMEVFNGNAIQLWPCSSGQQRNQQWTFHADGTIRSMGKCMTANNFTLFLSDCQSAPPGTTKWVVSIDGSITNVLTSLVLTASRAQAAQGAIRIDNNINEPGQSWRVGDDVQPIVTYIVGFNEMCLQANNANANVWLEDCVINRQQQRWALYSDGTIRVDSDRRLCLTSDGHRSGDIIIILSCRGWGNQRWVFLGLISAIASPNTGLVMDVRQSNVALRQIILREFIWDPYQNLTTVPSQKWMTVTRIS